MAIKTIANLIWTNIATNIFVGTRSWGSGSELPPNLQKRETSSSTANDQAFVPVTVYEQQIRYHWPFAIPALLTLLLFILVLFAAMLSLLSGKGLPARVRHYLVHLSSGRLSAGIQHPGECHKEAPTNQWIARAGKRQTDLQGYGIHAIGIEGAAAPFLGQYDHMTNGLPTSEKRISTISET